MTESHPIDFPKAVPDWAVALYLDLASELQAATGLPLEAVERLRTKFLERIGQSPEVVSLRVAGSVLCDLFAQGWIVERVGKEIRVTPPKPIEFDPAAEKDRVRANHLAER